MPKNKYTSRFKVETVLEGLRDPDGIADYCRRKGISDVSFYQWQKQLLANADALFEKPPKSVVKKIELLEQEIQRKDRIIALVTEEALELKKKTYDLKPYQRLNLEVKLDLLAMLNRYCQYGWTKQAICQQWGISPKTFYGIKPVNEKLLNPRRIQLNTITPFEREAIRSYALSHTEQNHRELAYRMLDEDIVGVSPSTVYRILKEYNLIRQRAKREKRDFWHPHQGVSRPDQVWQTDLMCLIFQQREYFLLSYLDVYSRFTVYHKLCLTMTGNSIHQASREAIEQTGIIPESIQSDNGSCYISQEYRSLMKKLEIDHRLIHPHCPNENAEIERYHRTVRELVDVTDATTFTELEELIKERIYYYNYIRYHSRIGFIPPYVKYRGNPDQIFEERKKKLERAKTKRVRINAQRMLSKT